MCHLAAFHKGNTFQTAPGVLNLHWQCNSSSSNFSWWPPSIKLPPNTEPFLPKSLWIRRTTLSPGMWEIHQQPPPCQLHTLVSGELELLCPLAGLDCGLVVDHTPQPCHWTTLLEIKPLQWKNTSFFLTYTASSFPFSFLLPCTWLLIRWWWGLLHAQKDPCAWETLGRGGVQCASPGKERSRGSHEVMGPPAGLDRNPELQGWGQKAAA